MICDMCLLAQSEEGHPTLEEEEGDDGRWTLGDTEPGDDQVLMAVGSS